MSSYKRRGSDWKRRRGTRKPKGGKKRMWRVYAREVRDRWERFEAESRMYEAGRKP